MGAVGCAVFLVILAMVTALRRYSMLLETDSVRQPGDSWGHTQGRFAGRLTAFSFRLPGLRSRRPGKLRVSLQCSAPLTFQADRESLAMGFQKIVGIRHDRAAGDEELDRMFLFEFDDREPFVRRLGPTEVRTAMLALARAGVDSIQLDEEKLTASIPLRLILPPRVSRVRQVLGHLAILASAMEQTLA